MSVDPVEAGSRAEAENLAFSRWLHDHRHPIEELQQIAVEVQREIDCTSCARCCREMVVAVSAEEIEAIASYLGIDPDLAARQYTTVDPEDSRGRVLRNEHEACTFLDENLCMVYEARPKACREFPHLSPGCHSLGARLSSLCRHATICPIVGNAFEIYKQRLGFNTNAQVRAASDRTSTQG